MRTTKEIFANGQALTLSAAKALVGKTISVTNVEYEANSSSVRTGKVLDIKSKWDIAGEEDYTSIDSKFKTRQDYWKSYMTNKQIEVMKQSLELVADNQLYAGCNINSDWFEEPTFHGSDADRAVYYILESEPSGNSLTIRENYFEDVAKHVREGFFLNTKTACKYYSLFASYDAKIDLETGDYWSILNPDYDLIHFPTINDLLSKGLLQDCNWYGQGMTPISEEDYKKYYRR